MSQQSFDLLHLMGADDDALVTIVVVVQQSIIELLAVEDIQTQGGFIQHQQVHVDGHNERQVQLSYHPLGETLYPLCRANRLLNDYYDGDKSIIISTHQVEEIEALLTHLIFIDRGEIILDIAMDDIANRFSEVLIHPDKVEQARQLNPIYERDLLGRKGLLFEDQDPDQLAKLGEIHVPGIADLFVAKMRGVRS